MVGCSSSLRPPKNKYFLHSATSAPQIPFKIPKTSPQSSGFSAEHACLMVGCSASLRPPKNKNFLHSATSSPQIPFKIPKTSPQSNGFSRACLSYGRLCRDQCSQC